jgi:hypothetical protein
VKREHKTFINIKHAKFITFVKRSKKKKLSNFSIVIKQQLRNDEWKNIIIILALLCYFVGKSYAFNIVMFVCKKDICISHCLLLGDALLH